MASLSALLLSWLLFCVSAYTLRSLPRHRLRVLTAQNQISGAPSDLSQMSGTNPTNGAYSFEFWSKAFRSQTEEFHYQIESKDVEGQIPVEFVGTLYRAMPSRFERAGVEYGHYLDGDGYIIRLAIDSKGAHFKSNFVKTKEFVVETLEDKICFRSTFRTQRPAARVKGLPFEFDLKNGFDLKLKNLANTNAVVWGKKLLALFEAGVPHELDPTSLETVGEYDMNIGDDLKPGMSVVIPQLYEKNRKIHNSVFGSCLTAHPKIDKRRGVLVGWVWRAEVSPERGPLDTRPSLSVYEWDGEMQVRGPPTRFTFEGTTVAPHDFSFTDNYYVFCENRISGNVMPYILGTSSPADCVTIDPSKSLALYLVARPPSSEGAAQVKASEGVVRIPLNSPGFAIHSVCAFESGAGELTLLTTAWKTETVGSGQVMGGLLGAWEGQAPRFDSIPTTLLYETIVDAGRGTLIRHAPVKGMEEQVVEHPHINPNMEGLPVRYIWMSIGSSSGLSSPPIGYMRLDRHTGDR